MSLFYPFIQRHGGQPRHIGTSQYPAVQGMVRQRYDPPVVGVKRSLLRVVNGQCEAQFQAGDQGGGQHQFSPLNTAQGAEENVALAGKTRVKDAPCTDVVLMTPEPCPAGECHLLEGDDGVIHHVEVGEIEHVRAGDADPLTQCTTGVPAGHQKGMNAAVLLADPQSGHHHAALGLPFQGDVGHELGGMPMGRMEDKTVSGTVVADFGCHAHGIVATTELGDQIEPVSAQGQSLLNLTDDLRMVPIPQLQQRAEIEIVMTGQQGAEPPLPGQAGRLHQGEEGGQVVNDILLPECSRAGDSVENPVDGPGPFCLLELMEIGEQGVVECQGMQATGQ